MRTTISVLMTIAMATAAMTGCTVNPPPLSQAQLGTIDQPYVLDANDKLRITVYNEPNLTGEYTVTGSGAIAFPLVGLVPVRNLTLEAASAALQARLGRDLVNDPKVSIEVLNYRPYYILGEVVRPGQYPFMNGMTVQQAVATAGGFTTRANTTTLFIRRSRAAEEGSVNGRGNAVPVLPGDTIRVGERYF